MLWYMAHIPKKRDWCEKSSTTISNAQTKLEAKHHLATIKIVAKITQTRNIIAHKDRPTKYSSLAIAVNQIQSPKRLRKFFWGHFWGHYDNSN
jgi:hypothetical protein